MLGQLPTTVKPRAERPESVYAQILEQIAKCTLKLFFPYVLELIWLKSEVVTFAALFHWPCLDSHRQMNHKQSLVVKTIGLLLQNVILCYPDSLCLPACMQWQNMWLNKTHIGSLTYYSVKANVNMNAL